MKIILKGTHLELTSVLRDYIEEKIGGLDTLMPNVDPSCVEAKVEVECTTNHHQKGDIFRAEVNLYVPGKLLRVEAKRDDINLAIVEAKDKLQREINQYKDSLINK